MDERWDFDAAAARTQAAMRAGAEVISQATFANGPWRGRADFLMRSHNSVLQSEDLGSHLSDSPSAPTFRGGGGTVSTGVRNTQPTHRLEVSRRVVNYEEKTFHRIASVIARLKPSIHCSKERRPSIIAIAKRSSILAKRFS
jgi:hypothetical protein